MLAMDEHYESKFPARADEIVRAWSKGRRTQKAAVMVLDSTESCSARCMTTEAAAAFPQALSFRRGLLYMVRHMNEISCSA